MQPLVNSLETLRISDGDHAGAPFRALAYQRRFLSGAFRPGILFAALTLARGGGKTGLLSALAADSIRDGGYLHTPRGETILVASSFAQACIGGDAVALMLADEHGELDKAEYRKVRSQNVLLIENRRTGARVRAVGSDNRRAHGWRPNLVLADEPAQWGARGESLDAAIRTSLGKRRNGRVLYFGTRPRSQEHFYARLLADQDPSVFVRAFAAKPDDPPFQKRTWLKANPALNDGFPHIEVLQAEARRAKRDPGLLASFRALRLNLGVSETDDADLLVDPAVWREILQAEAPDPDGLPVWEVDLGGAAAMSAIAACWPNGRLETLAMFGSEPNLEDRALRDGAGTIYAAAVERGELLISGRRIPKLTELFGTALQRWGAPSRIVCDRWRVSELKDALDGSDYPWQRIPLAVRGQGFRDGGEAMRSWRNAIAERRVHPVAPSALLTSALSEAVAVADPAGNEKLAKSTEGSRRLRARDDLAAATLLAVEFGLNKPEAPTLSYGGVI